MRRITKTNPPANFITYTRTSVPKPSFENLDKKEVIDLRISLLNEQGWICGYCQQQIKDSNKTKIEHHCEQSICNGENGTIDKTLDYTNLMIVCLGRSGLNILHCDTKKATFKFGFGLPIEVSPWKSSHMNSISYTSNGLIKSEIENHNREINEILSLNTKHLKELRGKKFALFYKYVKDLNAAKKKIKLRKLLEDDLEMGDNKFSNAFPGMSEYMLKKHC